MTKKNGTSGQDNHGKNGKKKTGKPKVEPDFAGLIPTPEQIASMSDQDILEAIKLHEKNAGIHSNRMTKYMVVVGRYLDYMRTKLGHGHWGNWCKEQLAKVTGFAVNSQATAGRRIALYRYFHDKMDKLPNTQTEAMAMIKKGEGGFAAYKEEPQDPDAKPVPPPTAEEVQQAAQEKKIKKLDTASKMMTKEGAEELVFPEGTEVVIGKGKDKVTRTVSAGKPLVIRGKMRKYVDIAA